MNSVSHHGWCGRSRKKHFASRKNYYWKCPHLCPGAHFIVPLCPRYKRHFHSMNVHGYSGLVANHFRLRRQNHTELNESFSKNKLQIAAVFIFCFLQHFTSQHCDFCHSLLFGGAVEKRLRVELKKKNQFWVELNSPSAYSLIKPSLMSYIMFCALFCVFSKLEFSFSTIPITLKAICRHYPFFSSKHPSKSFLDLSSVHWLPPLLSLHSLSCKDLYLITSCCVFGDHLTTGSSKIYFLLNLWGNSEIRT